jgi:hypothetical protein
MVFYLMKRYDEASRVKSTHVHTPNHIVKYTESPARRNMCPTSLDWNLFLAFTSTAEAGHIVLLAISDRTDGNVLCVCVCVCVCVCCFFRACLCYNASQKNKLCQLRICTMCEIHQRWQTPNFVRLDEFFPAKQSVSKSCACLPNDYDSIDGWCH